MKSKLQRLTKIGILTFGIIITVTNCSKDELTKDELTEIQKIKNEFSLAYFDNLFVKKNLQINWNDFRLNNSETSPKSTYEFSTRLKANDFIENGGTKLFFKYILEISKIRNNQWDFEVIKFTTEDKESLESISSFSSYDFSGTVTHFNLKGELTEIKGLEKGMEITPKLHNRIFAKGGPTPTDHDPSDSDSGGAGFQWIEVVHYTDWYKVYPDGTQEFTHRVYNYTTWEYIYVPANSNYSTNSPYLNHESNEYFVVDSNNNENVDEEDKVDDSKLTGKAKCIFDKLNESSSNLFKETIGKFIDDPEYNLTLIIGECSRSDDACTDSRNLDSTGEIIIKIEDNNANPLQMAQFILHEAIHAEIHRYVSRFESGVDPDNRARLFQLYDFYNDHFNIGDIQHVYMTERYINPIASALRKLDGFKYPLDYYKAFAWDGLRTWDLSNLLDPSLDSKYEEYRKIVIENTTISCD
ncbi:hypothetical protein VOI54_03260 [Tamlana sp. 2201CG12-4]|uniref:hypothetical protein n=1 Tax=Tamlana sp. 2201CG12-4 TaxID=3112582 RepID=UPI002DBD63EA|nr:hypothetical protein [Tamlana sp. 2201CG12-4]MEC3906019.1 hypothetical protein [Tamlana sp. 2201CG12-4]